MPNSPHSSDLNFFIRPTQATQVVVVPGHTLFCTRTQDLLPDGTKSMQRDFFELV